MSKTSYKSRNAGKIRKNYVSATALVLFAFILAALATISVSKPGTNVPTTVATNTNMPATISLIAPIAGTFDLGELTHVLWSSTNYTPSTVAVNVIRKVGDNPARYELVRTVAAATKNDGDAVWMPASSELGSNIELEVACAPSSQECHASQSGTLLAVNDTGRFGNTAAAATAIENQYNR